MTLQSNYGVPTWQSEMHPDGLKTLVPVYDINGRVWKTAPVSGYAESTVIGSQATILAPAYRKRKWRWLPVIIIIILLLIAAAIILAAVLTRDDDDDDDEGLCGQCKNGGSCVMMDGSHECRCAIGYTGSTCETRSEGVTLKGTATVYDWVWDDDLLNSDSQDFRTAEQRLCNELQDLGNFGSEFQCEITQFRRRANLQSSQGSVAGDFSFSVPQVFGQTTMDRINNIIFAIKTAIGFDERFVVRFDGETTECLSDNIVCGNNGWCLQGIGTYRCLCRPGTTGTHCETDINDCSPNPCGNGGTCTDALNSYTCQCLAGFIGTNCHTNVNDCVRSPCVNGRCVDGINDYTCICDADYSGKNCDTVINNCSPNQCVNGDCRDGINTYTCNCSLGYTGRNCESEIDHCDPNPCLNQATCLNRPDEYECACAVNFYGDNCEFRLSECTNSPCDNGECVDTDTGDRYRCVCFQGYTGDHCETLIDYCESSPCVHGTCATLVNSYRCDCDDDHIGDHCEFEINPCNGNRCLNGGTCFEEVQGYRCFCSDAYTGTHCETIVDQCASAPCLNGGSCVSGIGTHQCFCAVGSTGVNCEQPWETCDNHQCINGGTCVPGNFYTCDCQPGFSGFFCHIVDDPCIGNQCVNGATCNPVGNTYTCMCLDGYAGAFCQQDINDCVGVDCGDGVCSDLVNDYECQCSVGYTDEHCETNIDDCEAADCGPGECVDLVNDYECSCPEDYSGSHCETELDPCRHKFVCVEDGSCINYHQFCDGRADCPMGTDEEGCFTFIQISPGTKQSRVYMNSADPSATPGEICDVGFSMQHAHKLCQDAGFNGAESFDVDVPALGNIGYGIANSNWVNIFNNLERGPCHTTGVIAITCEGQYPCLDEPCQNGGTCRETSQDSYECTCEGGFLGSDCESTISCLSCLTYYVESSNTTFGLPGCDDGTLLLSVPCRVPPPGIPLRCVELAIWSTGHEGGNMSVEMYYRGCSDGDETTLNRYDGIGCGISAWDAVGDLEALVREADIELREDVQIDGEVCYCNDRDGCNDHDFSRCPMIQRCEGSRVCLESSECCNGVDNCNTGSDERNCLRVNSDGEVRAKRSCRSPMRHVCAAGWTADHSDAVCRYIGTSHSVNQRVITRGQPAPGYRLSDPSNPMVLGNLMDSDCANIIAITCI